MFSDTEGHSPSILRRGKKSKSKEGRKSLGADGSKSDGENKGGTLKKEKRKSFLSLFMRDKDKSPKTPKEKKTPKTPDSKKSMTLKSSTEKKFGVKLRNKMKSPKSADEKAKEVKYFLMFFLL